MTKRQMNRLLTTAALLIGVGAGFAAPNLARAAENQPAEAARASATAAPIRFTVDYTGSLFVFPLGKLRVDGLKDNNSYSLRADMDTSGLGKIAKSQGLWSTTTGYFTPDHVRPRDHVIQKLDAKGRRIALDFSTGTPVATIEPRFGSMGVPPASETERAEAVDALSAILQMMTIGQRYGDKPCEGSIPVFDGKQRYNLNLSYVGRQTVSQQSYKGEVVKCHLFMETVSGYDPEDLLTPEEAATPLDVYLADYKEAGLWVPVRFDYRVSGIKVNIRATNISIKSNPA